MDSWVPMEAREGHWTTPVARVSSDYEPAGGEEPSRREERCRYNRRCWEVSVKELNIEPKRVASVQWCVLLILRKHAATDRRQASDPHLFLVLSKGPVLIHYVTKTLVLWTVLLLWAAAFHSRSVMEASVAQSSYSSAFTILGSDFHPKERQTNLCRTEKWKADVIHVLETVLIICLCSTGDEVEDFLNARQGLDPREIFQALERFHIGLPVTTYSMDCSKASG